ncbi:YbaB/EbfC family nucleoid-associated protein [Streptosporangium amethystogenes subsp. fukuiense]|uniref:YbaB/EbfC family nucleoid-associated protein n=1 Tax=Streptosporangium amethystogenes subsp. fukuiense TaxID=698418 RepID=A0ABW2TD87_9ACTN
MIFDPDNFDLEDLERIGREAEKAMERLANVQGELEGIRGTGTGADGLISVITNGSGHLEKIELNPRVMRLDSHALADELTKAFRESQEDGERQARELLGGALGEDMQLPREPFDFTKTEQQLTQAYDSFARSMEERMGGAGRPDRG